jgi:pimeloyl-ACP methyl ester carboxylesterase
MSFRSYALDLWGFGDSAKEPSHYSLDQQSALVERFFQEMGMVKIALVGHGLGALVALLFTRKFPALVDRLMVVGMPFEIEAVANRFRTAASPVDLADWLLGKGPLTEAARQDASKADLQSITMSLNSLDALSFFPFMDSFATPCLVVHGTNDPAIQTPDYERIEAMEHTVHQVILENSGHFPMLDENPRFNRLLTDFLALGSGESPRQLQLKDEWKRRVR